MKRCLSKTVLTALFQPEIRQIKCGTSVWNRAVRTVVVRYCFKTKPAWNQRRIGHTADQGIDAAYNVVIWCCLGTFVCTDGNSAENIREKQIPSHRAVLVVPWSLPVRWRDAPICSLEWCTLRACRLFLHSAALVLPCQTARLIHGPRCHYIPRHLKRHCQ